MRVLIIIVALAAPVFAQHSLTAAELQEKCQAYDRYREAERTHDFKHIGDTDATSAGVCIGFIQGWGEQVHNIVVTNDASFGIGHLDFRQALTNEQIEVFYQRFAAEQPETWNKPAADVLTEAMFDCDLLAVRLNGGAWMPKPTIGPK